MLVIRLQRTGRENLPTYRLVVAEKARPVKGKYLEIVGHYLPARDPVQFEHKDERIQHWIGKGAIPSDTVARLLRRAGLSNMEKFIVPYAKQKSKKEATAQAPAQLAAPAEAPAPAPAETPGVKIISRSAVPIF
ncbi:30S ribosomal protein S16 [Candidatus Peregrinibacteria bacterium]|nr:30S ribosomal protein S16 [Candidatus Peregrinibacteria bacterium]